MAKQYPRILALVSLLALLVALVPAAGVSAQGDGIDFNGIFYGDDDYLDYVPLAQNPDRGYLYYYEDGTYLYLAVVVLPSVNDNVFGASRNGDTDRDYVFSAGWTQEHSAKKLEKSDNLQIGFTCNGQAFDWYHGYAYLDGDTWASGPLDDSIGGGTWPAPMEFKSSFAYNLNSTFSGAWDVTLGGDRTTLDDWKSPDTPVVSGTFLPGNNDVTDEDGWGPDLTDATWRWYNDDYDWEWAMVYEERLPLSFCQGTPWAVTVYSAHNSPPKSGTDDVPMAVYDWGDAPEGVTINAGTPYEVVANYGTTLANNGPKHQIITDMATGQRLSPIMGLVVDAEADGQPGVTAADDDFRPYLIPGFGDDDEDGLQMPLAELEAGKLYTLWISGTAGAGLDGWIDLNLDGDFDEGGLPATPGGVPPADRIAALTLTGAPQPITFTVPASFPSGEGAPKVVTYGRFRVTRNPQPLPPTESPVLGDPALGQPPIIANDGEVEDYVFTNFVPTAIDLADFGAQAQGGAIEVAWETADEIDNLGFNLYRAASKAGARVKLNDGLIPSQVAPGSPVGAAYTWLDEDVEASTTYYYWLEDVESSGKTKLHGPVTAEVVNLTFEPVQPVPIRRIMPVRLR